MGQMLAQSGAPQLPDPGQTGLSRDEQIQLGRKAAAEVYQQMPVLTDNSAETQYIRQIGDRLAATMPREYSWPFEFHTIPQKEINAFALPGGPMFVNVGTITAAANEAQLAGVMAHEMAHVYMQHSAKQMKQNTVPSIIAGVGQILGSMIGGVGGAAASIGGQLTGGMLSMKFSRADEAQADAVGAIIMYRAGYNPKALADFFSRMAEEGGSSGGPQFLSDHPNPGNREAAIEKEIENWPDKNYRTSSASFDQARAHAKGQRVYTAQEIANGSKSGQWAQMNQKNGAIYRNAPPVSNNGGYDNGQGTPAPTNVSLRDVMPSSQFRTENLGPLTISHPENWDVIAPQQQGASVTIAPRAGVVGNGIGYGVVINGAGAPNGQQMSIDQMTSEIVRSLQSGGGDLQQVGNAKSIRVNGVRGRSVPMESTSPFTGPNGQPQKERDWLVTLPQQDGSVMYFVFVAPAGDFSRLQPTFNTMLKSVRF